MRWGGLTFEVPSSWEVLPTEELTVVHPAVDHAAFRPTFTARFVPAEGRTLTQTASLAAAMVTTTAPNCFWLDTAPVVKTDRSGARRGRRQIFLFSSPVGELFSCQWLVEAGDRFLEMTAHCTVWQSAHLQPLMLHFGDAARWEGQG